MKSLAWNCIHGPIIVATVHSQQVIQFASEIIGRIHQCTEANTNYLAIPCKICELFCRTLYNM